MMEICDVATMEINFDDFGPVPEARNRLHRWLLTAHPNGQVALNKSFREEIRSKTNSFHLGFHVHKTDKRFLLIFITESPNYTFSPGDGGRKDEYFTRELVKNGVILPAKYEFRWNQKANAWVGILCGELSSKAKAKSLEMADRKRRGKEK